MTMIRSDSGLMMHPRYVTALRQAGWASLDGLLQADIAEELHKPGLPQWRKRARLELDGQAVYLKTFSRAGGEGRSDARVEYDWLVYLAARGIPTPTPIAFGEAHDVSALLMAEAPGVSLEKWLPAHRERWLSDAALRARVIEAVADLARHFHRLGVAHRDFYLAHLFYADDVPPRITLIDLQRVVRPTWWGRMGRWIRKDLAQLHYATPDDLVTRAERIAFYKRYQGLEHLALVQWVQMALIASKARRIAKHDARKKARHAAAKKLAQS